MGDHTYFITEEQEREREIAQRIFQKKMEDIKRSRDRRRQKTRINIGAAFPRWRALMKDKCFRTNAEVACFLLNRYLRTKSESQPDPLSLERSSSTDTCESVHYEYPFMRSSSNEAEPDTRAASSVQSSKNGKVTVKKGAAHQTPKSRDERTTTKKSENKENRIKEEDEEFSSSLSVGDGRYLVDLGSSSEFIVDEECLLQLFRSCRECNRQCSVRKRVRGLKLVVYQTCCFCQNRFKWTNLSDDEGEKDDGDFQLNGTDAAHGQNTGNNTS